MSSAVPNWQAARAQAEAEAAALLDGDPAFAAAVPLIAAVLDQLLANDPTAEEASLLRRLGTDVATRLRAAGHGDCADAFQQRLVSADASFTPSLIAVELATGAATGEFFGRNPGDLELTLARQVLEALPAAFRTFDITAEATLRQTPGGATLLNTVLRQRAANFAIAPHETLFIYPPLPAILPDLNRAGRLIDAWEGSPGSRPVFVRDAFAYDLLRRTDSGAYLTAVETLPHPDLARHVIAAAGRRASLSELCLLLRHAAPAFDTNGTWLQKNSVPFLLLALCTERLSGGTAARHGGADTSASSTASTAAGDMMPEILDALAARQDGVLLGYAWLQYLIWSGHARARWHKGPLAGPPADLLIVLQRLGAWLPPHAEPEKWIAEEQELWRNDRIYSIVMVLLSHGTAEHKDIADFIALVLQQDHASSFGVDRLAEDGGSHERHIIGSAIGTIPDVATWFMGLWANLFHLRDRARRYLHGRNSQIPPNVGQVAVLWTLCGLGYINPASEASRALWVQVEAATREGILTDGVRLHNDAWRAALCWLGAYWPVIFPDDPPAGSPGSLDDFVSFWAAPFSEFAVLIQQMRHQGVTIEQLIRSIPHGQLLRHGADELDRKRGVDHGSKIASAIRTIADDIDTIGSSRNLPERAL